MDTVDQSRAGELEAAAAEQLLGRARDEQHAAIRAKAHHRVLHMLDEVPIGVDLALLVDLEHGVQPMWPRAPRCSAVTAKASPAISPNSAPQGLRPDSGRPRRRGNRSPPPPPEHRPGALLDRRARQQRGMHGRQQRYREAEIGNRRIGHGQQQAAQQRGVDLPGRGALVLAALAQRQRQEAGREADHRTGRRAAACPGRADRAPPACRSG